MEFKRENRRKEARRSCLFRDPECAGAGARGRGGDRERLWGLGFSSRGVKTQGVTWVHQLCSLVFSLIVLMDLAVATSAAFTGDPGCVAGGWLSLDSVFLFLPSSGPKAGPLWGPYGLYPLAYKD